MSGRLSLYAFLGLLYATCTKKDVFVLAEVLPNGSSDCPCLTAEELDRYDRNVSLYQLPRSYGAGCWAHDVGTTPCMPAASDPECEAQFPRPESCDRSWCEKEWCFVDGSNCRLAHESSTYFPKSGLDYSYATCSNMDKFANEEQAKLLEGKTYRVGFTENSGGWKGAYSTGGHFSPSGWSGPTVDFFERAAYERRFVMNRTGPPDFIAEESEEFFSSSAFDSCVYATSLGYLDFCVGRYTITSKRAASATFFTLYSEPLFLIVVEDGGNWSTFFGNVGNIFLPFTPETWIFVIFGVIPLMSFLISFHENGLKKSKPLTTRASKENQKTENDSTDIESDHSDLGSSSSKEEKPRVTLPDSEQRVKVVKKIGGSLFRGYNSFFQQAYSKEGNTIGGRLTVLGFGFFFLTFAAAYTANLAAILTENARSSKIETIEDAIKAGYNFCGSRNQASIVMDLYQISDLFVPDPEDGKPGFNCKTCKERTRSLDFLKPHHNDGSLYCNAAILALEDIEEMQAQGIHCNKTAVGGPLAYIDIGVPIFEGVSKELIASFQEYKNRGLYETLLNQAKPEPRCLDKKEEGMSLTITQLSGVWVITLGFALAGLVAKCLGPRIEKYAPSVPSRTIAFSRRLSLTPKSVMRENKNSACVAGAKPILITPEGDCYECTY